MGGKTLFIMIGSLSKLIAYLRVVRKKTKRFAKRGRIILRHQNSIFTIFNQYVCTAAVCAYASHAHAHGFQ